MAFAVATSDRLHENAIAQTTWDIEDALYASTAADASIYLRRAVAHMERYGLTESDLDADTRGQLTDLRRLLTLAGEPIA